MKTEAFIHGIYPQSEGLIEANQGLDKGRVSARDHLRIQALETFNLVALQKDAEFVFTENGQFEWQDTFRPLIDSSSGLVEGPLKRWFDTDTFYRQPVFSAAPQFNPERFNKYISQFSGIDQKVTLPSPFTFAKLSEGQLSGSFDATLGLTTEFLGRVVQYLAGKGIKAIQLNEPYLPYSGATPGDIEKFLESLRHICSIPRNDTKLFVHLNFGDGASALKAIDGEDIDLDGVGVDFYKTKLSKTPTNISRPLIAGVINSAASRVEDKDEITSFVSKIADHARPLTLYLTHTADLEYVPANIAKQKVRLLGELTK